MDSIHDLGGVEGFGPIKVETAHVPFHEAWEGCQLTGAADWTIDWWRHIREAAPPVDYLTTPYFASWAMTQAVALVDSGILTIEEIVSGRPDGLGADMPQPASLADVMSQYRSTAARFDQSTHQEPKFAVGNRVRAAKHGHAGHTRLPRYVRGFIGEIEELLASGEYASGQEVNRKTEEWRNAYLSTPHGQPVMLGK